MSDVPVRRKWLFDTGTQYLDWVLNECGPCRYYNPDRPIGMGCPVEEAVAKAYVLGRDKVPVPEELEEIDPLAYHPYRCKRRKLGVDWH
jgi:hypothetical protein